MNNTTENATASSTVVRLFATSGIKSLVKECKKVGYSVTVLRNSDFGKGPIWGYEVHDANSLVFKSICVRPNLWGTTLNKKYWMEPVA
jgi:hypothetical protein